MSHHCEHECDHDHAHDGPDRGFEFTLYQHIDTENVVCLNEKIPDSCQKLFKPWDKRYDVSEYTESDADQQLLFLIPFTGNVKLKSISIMGGPDDRSPAHFKVFVNQDTLDFDAAERGKPTQEWDMVRDAPKGELVEYQTKIALFNNVRKLGVFITDNFGADTTVVHYIGLKGEFTPVNRNPIITTYEAAARPSDHKVDGTVSKGLDRMID